MSKVPTEAWSVEQLLRLYTDVLTQSLEQSEQLKDLKLRVEDLEHALMEAEFELEEEKERDTSDRRLRKDRQ